jgi:hypothetical protein
MDKAGADPGFQVRGGALTKIAPSGGRREICLGISCAGGQTFSLIYLIKVQSFLFSIFLSDSLKYQISEYYNF